eukprot:CAMPEP_0201282594 /NCGR_PEP_ID=MMETSP1317-20130820/6092_1 /ASSEMBLY_ACC=CAM_ASM_000770 /TAXON_ID=187299 /ORGANISM="Undescribed Undescribed, Strain Undescribed" /LENGTH=49 /DNA_ID= /DNA_START= /DNA_END= /DNA_ORIENTATION=
MLNNGVDALIVEEASALIDKNVFVYTAGIQVHEECPICQMEYSIEDKAT